MSSHHLCVNGRAQLRERGYADKYRHLGVPVHLVGVEFSKQTRNVERFETELA